MSKAKRRKKCELCSEESLPGLLRALCQYHYNWFQWGKEWADKCREENKMERNAKEIK